MARILGTYPNKGFSLLELLVVLLFMSLLGSVLFPQLNKVREASLFNTEKLQLAHAIKSLPFFCMQNALALKLDKLPSGIPEVDKLILIPQGWAVEVKQTLVVNATGFCSGGQILMRKDDREILLDVLAPDCSLQVAVKPDST